MNITEILPTVESSSPRMTMAPTAPWWKVRPSLMGGLGTSVALAVAAYTFTGVSRGWTISPTALKELMTVLSATPTLATIGVLACVLMLRPRGGASLRILCGVLAFAAITGAGLNVARATGGQGAIEVWVEQALAQSQDTLSAQAK